MLDPFPPAPTGLVQLVRPAANALNLPSLPYHVHEILAAAILYQIIQEVGSPLFSRTFFRSYYESFNIRTRINWDVHVVSMVQSCLITILALYVMIFDEERKNLNTWHERTYGYTGACGMIQALAAGYFVWDLGCVTRYYKIFGPGLLAHAVTALSVYILGFVRKPLISLLISG